MTSNASDIFTAIQKDRNQAAISWKAAGGKVVGYLSNAIPLEVIHAAGMLPIHLSGDPAAETPLADRFLEPAFDPFTRSVLQRLLAGDFSFVDLLVLPRSNDSYQRLYYYLCELHRKHPEWKLPPVYLLDLLHSPRPSTAEHNLKKLTVFSRFLSDFAGSEVTDSDLAGAIHSYNKARVQLQRFTSLRARKDIFIPSTLAHAIYAGAQSLPIQVFTTHLTSLNDALSKEGANDAHTKRVIIAGNGLDHPLLHRCMDALGVQVVGDYHSLGNHFLVSRVDEDKAPMLALNDHYHGEIKSTRSFAPNVAEVADFAQQQNADAVVFFYLLREEALTWHYPRQRNAAEAAGLGTVLLNEQDYRMNEENLLPLLKGVLKGL